MHLTLIFMIGALTAIEETPAVGSIGGVVVNASQNDATVPGAEVALRVQVEGQFVVAGETTADAQGQFLFDSIPAAAEYVYLPGANRQGVHYPGQRVSLESDHPHAFVRLEVRDAIQTPNPLVIRDHDIVLEPAAGVLRVTETLLVDNPSPTTYVGRPAGKSARATTLALSIPPGFDRATFQQEFYGRNFVVIDDKLVTDVPWTPGTRTLKFTYVLSHEQAQHTWERPVDLPTDKVHVTVRTAHPEQVSSNLSSQSAGGGHSVAFTASAVPAGHVLRVEMGDLKTPLTAYLPWLAVLLLVGLIALTARRLRHVHGGAARTPAPKSAIFRGTRSRNKTAIR